MNLNYGRIAGRALPFVLALLVLAFLAGCERREANLNTALQTRAEIEVNPLQRGDIVQLDYGFTVVLYQENDFVRLSKNIYGGLDEIRLGDLNQVEKIWLIIRKSDGEHWNTAILRWAEQ